VVRTRPPGRWASLRAEVKVGEDLGPLFVEVERHVQDQGARAAQPPVLVVHETRSRSRTVELLIPIDRSIVPSDRVESVSTRAARVASSLVVGSYEPLPEVVADLRAWAGRTGREVVGSPWYVYLRFAAEEHLRLPEEYLTAQAEELVTEVQLELREP